MKLPFFTKRLTDGQLWCLAAGGVLTDANDEPFDRLKSRYSKAGLKDMLRDWWEVSDRTTLRLTLEWLDQEGHRKELRESMPVVAGTLSSLSNGDSIEFSEHEEFIANNLHMLQRTGFVSWDFTRLINVARWGYSCGFISEEESWYWITRSARVVRESLTGWKDVADDFVLGHRYWSIGRENIRSIKEPYERFINRSDSPWKRIEWSISPDRLNVE